MVHNLHLVIAIPCHDEPDLLTTLDSVRRCRPPPCPVDVVVVINGAANDAPPLQARNRLTWQTAQAWVEAHPDEVPAVHLLFEPALPPRLAGVGTARKIGMDWAMHRFAHGAGEEGGVIVCLDADCQVAANYLEALYDHFATHPQTPGCSLYFEHDWRGLPPAHRLGIIRYELYLRYYLHGLRWSGFPHAFHTVGSSMAVRAIPYRQQGGMNRRKAGEDFYFLQKIIPLGHFSALDSTTVFPSARASHRVPFGTGRAMAEGLAGSKDLGVVYDPRLFQGLGQLFQQVEAIHAGTPASHLRPVPPVLQHFLAEQHWERQWQEMRANTASLAAFRKRFFQGFNAFQILKYIHFATDRGWPKISIEEAATTLLTAMEVPAVRTESEALLACYRQLDRAGHWRVGF
ncbi:MAG: glycosyltransferase [Magnetococcales bacterium]|nr:glycosyltransferase [Magnetococcales bacterium]